MSDNTASDPQPSAAPAPGASPAFASQLGLLFVACATLLLQVSWTRALSVTLWYHFAFLVISTAMLGFGLSGVLLTLSKRLASIPLGKGLVIFASGQAITTVGGFWLANRIPFAPFSLLSDGAQLAYAPLYLLCIATPFVFSGLCAALLLSRRAAHAGRIYAFDLVGAGAGCLLVTVVMPSVGAAGSVLLSAALAMAGVFCFASADGSVGAGSDDDATPPNAERWRVVAAAALLLLVVAASFFAERALPLRISSSKRFGKTPMHQVLRSKKNLYTGWTTSSRVDVLPTRWGRSVLIDAGTAMTRMPRVRGKVAALGPIRDERRIVLDPGAKQRVLIIGSGGGWEVLAALRTDAAKVVAVEINPLIVDLVRGSMKHYVGGIFADPRVELHVAEARAFIRRDKRRFDVIMASHTISNAATASGALSLAEEYILTAEAFDEYLAHLSKRGALWLSRPAAQLPRLTTTAREALSRAGVEEPARHVLVFYGGPFYGGLVVRRAPMSSADARRASRLLRRARLFPLHVPGRTIRLPRTPKQRYRDPAHYKRLLTMPQTDLRALYFTSKKQLRPATDDRPFFNQRTRWADVDLSTIGAVFKQSERGRLAVEDQPVAEVVLVVVLVQSALLALLLVFAPLWWRKRAALRGPGRARLLSYFLALGLGFILVEIVLIQRFTLFIGRPVIAFAVVVGALLVASGLGSLLSRRVAPDNATLVRRLRGVLAAISVAVVLSNLLYPPLLRAALALSLPARAAIATLALAPLGLLLGMAFPLGLRVADQHAPSIIPWAWGLNAVASVVGSVLAIILATAAGFSNVTYAAAAVYAAAILVWLQPLPDANVADGA